MEDIAVVIKKEKEISEALDKEHRAIWVQLTRCQVKSTDDYTSELFDEQIKNQDAENSARCASVSCAQGSVMSTLKNTSTMYETANYGVDVLLETIRCTDGEINAICDRVETAKHKRESSSAEKVMLQKSKLDKIGQSILVTKQSSSGLDELSAILSELKIAENATFTSVKDGIEAATHRMKHKTSLGDNLRSSIITIERQSGELRQILEKEKQNLHLQEAKLAKKHNELEELKKLNSENSEKVMEKQKNLEEICERYSSADAQLSMITTETKDICKKLDGLRTDSLATENDLALYLSKWQEQFNDKKEKMSQELRELEREVTEKQEEYNRLNCKLEYLKSRFNNSQHMKNWDEMQWQEVLREKSEAHCNLEAEVTNFSNDVMKLEKDIDDFGEGNITESILALEQELITYMEEKELERKSVHAKSIDAVCKLDVVREKVSLLQAAQSERESEYAKLLFEVKDLQSQIEAFTNLCTPSKVVGAPTQENYHKSPTSGQCLSRRKPSDPDSDNDSSSSRVRDVEGLDPFSPVTISLKKRTREESIARQGQFGFKNQGMHNSFASFSDTSITDKSLQSESIVAKRFPNDIFLSPTPSLVQIESTCSPDVSTFFATDGEQSIWSLESSNGQKDDLDSTVQTDLDQSVW